LTGSLEVEARIVALQRKKLPGQSDFALQNAPQLRALDGEGCAIVRLAQRRVSDQTGLGSQPSLLRFT